jgi:hypothetical protein
MRMNTKSALSHRNGAREMPNRICDFGAHLHSRFVTIIGFLSQQATRFGTSQRREREAVRILVGSTGRARQSEASTILARVNCAKFEQAKVRCSQ